MGPDANIVAGRMANARYLNLRHVRNPKAEGTGRETSKHGGVGAMSMANGPSGERAAPLGPTTMWRTEAAGPAANKSQLGIRARGTPAMAITTYTRILGIANVIPQVNCKVHNVIEYS